MVSFRHRAERVLGIVVLIVWVIALCSIFRAQAAELSYDDVKRELSNKYLLIDATDDSLWYASEMFGLRCQVGYVFVDNRLIGIAWDFDDTSKAAYTKIADELARLDPNGFSIKHSHSLALFHNVMFTRNE